MIKTCLLLLLFALSFARNTHLKNTAVFDVKSIKLTQKQTQSFQFKNLNKHRAFMINLQQFNNNSPKKRLLSTSQNEIKDKKPAKQQNPLLSSKSNQLKNLEQNLQDENSQKQTSYPTPTAIGLQITITNSNNPIKSCVFQYSNNLCVLENTTNTIIVNILCTVQKCDHSLVFSQRQIIEISALSKDTKQLNDPGVIYKLSKRRFNSILQVFSQREKYLQLSSEIKIFSNVHVFCLDQVEELQANNALFGIKPIKNDNDQYIFIENNRVVSTQHLKFHIKSHTGELNDANPIVDFIQNYGKHSKNVYIFNSPLQKNIQAKLRIFSPHNPKDLHFAFRVLAKNTKEQEPTEIGVLKFDPIEFDGVKLYDFSYIIPKSIHGRFKMIWFESYISQGEDRSLFFEIQVKDVQIFQISILEDIFFNANQKESLKFVVEPQLKLQIDGNDKDIRLITISSQKYYSSTETCSLHKGCQFQIKTEKLCSSCKFNFNLDNQDIKNGIIFYEVNQDAIQGRIDIDQVIYFKYPIKAKGTIQIVINSINVLMYAILDDYSQCSLPNPICQQYIINHQSPTYIQNKQKENRVIVIALHGLQKTSFKIRFLQKHNGINLSLGEKFTYLLDDDQNSMNLKFSLANQNIQANQHIIFNLLSPINSLLLTVTNINGRTINSNVGYIIFQKNQINDNQFEIKIQKIKEYLSQYVHFTLVISTNEVAVRLDSTITHYQRYLPLSSRVFVMEFDPNVKSALNIYTQNLQKQKANFSATIKILKNDEDLQENSMHLATLNIVRDYEFISLDELMSSYDECQDMNCEIQLTLKYQGKNTIDQAITLFSTQSIISLYDSLWNVFSINQLSKSNHFYFIPRNQKQSTHIIFNTEDINLYITYRIHNTQNSVNPQNWPFQLSAPEKDDNVIAGNNYISISNDDPELKKCWPNCAILINVHQVSKAKVINDKKTASQLIKSYKILATNNIIQLPQDTKLQFILQQEQEISLFIMLHNFKQSQQLTFFTSYTIGSSSISASIIDNDRQFNIQKDNKLYIFQGLQNQIPIFLIDEALKTNYGSWNSSMLKITIKAETDLKMNLEFTSQMKDIYRLEMGDLEFVNLYPNQQTIYQFIPERDWDLKLYRIQGIPMYKLIQCKENDYIECVNFIKKLHVQAEIFFNQNKENFQKLSKNAIGKKEEGDQAVQLPNIKEDKTINVLMQKTFEFSDQSCESCIYFLWLYCFDDSIQVSINLRATDSQTQLKQFSAVNDRIQEKGLSRRYLLNLIPQKNAYISIRLLAGTINVQVKGERDAILFKAQLNSTQDYADFIIQGLQVSNENEKDRKQTKQKLLYSDKEDDFKRQRSVFRHIIMTVVSASKQPTDYIISYSNGQKAQYLEDGIILQKHLIPQIPQVFFYKSKNKTSNPLLTLTSQLQQGISNSLKGQNKIIPRFFYYPDIHNKKLKQQFKPEMPPKRNQNYLGQTVSQVYELPAKFDLFQIEINAKSYIQATVSISHQQLVYVPLGYEYVVKLTPQQKLTIVVQNPHASYLQVFIKKCDNTLPSLKITNSALQFTKGNFQSEIDLQNNQIKQYISTDKVNGPIYMMFVGDQEDSSIMSVYMNGVNSKSKKGAVKYKAGNEGIIDYMIMDDYNVKINFKPVMCNGKLCTSEVTYYLIIGSKIDDIYSQINCAANYFIPQAKKLQGQPKTQIIAIKKEDYNDKLQMYSYKLKLNDNQSYIGIRAVTSQMQELKDINYIPIQITSIWKQLSKISFWYFIVIASFCSLFITIVIVISTKVARKGYRPISSNQ